MSVHSRVGQLRYVLNESKKNDEQSGGADSYYFSGLMSVFFGSSQEELNEVLRQSLIDSKLKHMSAEQELALLHKEQARRRGT